MNKKELLEKLKKELSLDDAKIKKIEAVFNKYFVIGKNNKDKILEELKNKLKLTDEQANKIYNKFAEVVGNGIKDKIVGLFKSKK